MNLLREWGALAVGYVLLIAAIVIFEPPLVARYLASLTN
jgi:hypothetical protein